MSLSYTDTLHYLYEKLPMFQRIGSQAIKKDLDNTLKLCRFLGNPQLHFKSIHIAGTNGKGSTAHMLAAAMQAAGYKTGLYTSPHLVNFRERIRINGRMIPEKEVIDFVENSLKEIEQIHPSFFEVTVAMAFYYFAKNKVEIAIIETGLGGRLDSTNIIMPLVSVITNISLDHQYILGNTLTEIAGEKAGIIKKGVPVIIGRKQLEIAEVFYQKAQSMESDIYFAEELITTNAHSTDKLFCASFQLSNKENIQACTDLNAVYQEENLRTVIGTLQVIKNKQLLLFDWADVLSGISKTRQLTGLQGRWQIINKVPLTIVDGAHNPDGIRHMLQQVQSTPKEQLHIVLGMVKDKDTSTVLSLLPKDAHYYFTQPNLPRAFPAILLQKASESYELKGNTYEVSQEALVAARLAANKKDLILVTGSLFLAGELLV